MEWMIKTEHINPQIDGRWRSAESASGIGGTRGIALHAHSATDCQIDCLHVSVFINHSLKASPF